MYSLDTSALSNPLEKMPPSLLAYIPIWNFIYQEISNIKFLITWEIYEELMRLENDALVSYLKTCKDQMVYEKEDFHLMYKNLKEEYSQYIYKLGATSRNTVTSVDISVIALAKVKNIPVISMEVSAGNSEKKKRIPDICAMEKIEHLTFNDYLKREWPQN